MNEADEFIKLMASKHIRLSSNMDSFHIPGQNAGHAMLHMMVEIMSDNAVIMKTLAAIKANGDQSKSGRNIERNTMR